MNFSKLNKVVIGLIMAVITLSSTLTATVASSNPAGARLVLSAVQECKINLEKSTTWNGTSEDLVGQVSWLLGQLPETCRENYDAVSYCPFTNIDLFKYQRLRVERFMDGLGPERAALVSEKFAQCWPAVNMPDSLVQLKFGNGEICITGNKFVLTTTGKNNRVSASQKGCNVAYITIVGNNVVIEIQQIGKNITWLSFAGDSTSLSLSQQGQNTYVGNFTGGENINITQIN